jgi:hypothetical protein
MRAIASAEALGRATNTALKVIWCVNPDVGARYEDIFRPTDRYKILDVNLRRSPRDILHLLIYCEWQQIKGVPTAWVTRSYFHNRVFANLRPGDFSDRRLEEIVRSGRRTLLTSWWSFYGEPTLDFSMFALHEQQQAELDEISGTFTENTVGVHIRRTDNVNAIRYSPTHAFITAMKECLAADPDARFFLTTDCSDTEREITKIFGNQITSRRRKLGRDSAAGLCDAAVDLFLLSRTSRILGSYYSTFSETAASIGQIEWVTVTDDASLVGKINSKVHVVPRS